MASHNFLKKQAPAGGGDFHRVEEMPAFLRQMQYQNLARFKPKQLLRPNWRTTGRSSFLLIFFVLFMATLALEWLLRRCWGMV